jgi:hypothetical protein
MSVCVWAPHPVADRIGDAGDNKAHNDLDRAENLAHHGLPPGPPLAPPGRLHPDTVHAIMARTQVRCMCDPRAAVAVLCVVQ